MLGNIIGINDNEIILKLTVDVSKMANLISSNGIMEDY